jgi:hypothetical protein
MPGANHLVIRTVDAPEVARRKMSKLLRQQGFAFDTETGPTIVTNWRTTPALGNGAHLKVSAFIENEANATTIKMRGRLRTDVVEDAPIEYVSSADSAAHDPFARLEDLAYAYPDGTVYYGRD